MVKEYLKCLLLQEVRDGASINIVRFLGHTASIHLGKYSKARLLVAQHALALCA
jgi:hypothetical protein